MGHKIKIVTSPATIVLVTVASLWLLNFLNGFCFIKCIVSRSPMCTNRCAGAITIFGTSVKYFTEIMAYQKGTVNDFHEVYPINNAHAFCHKRQTYPDEGVNMHKYPLGWIEQADGTWTGCENQTDYPVMQNEVFSYNSHKDVKRLMQEFPRAEYRGEVHRGNEFAFAMTSGAVHQDINPPLAMLASPVELRMKTNPLIRSLFTPERLGKDTEGRLRKIVKEYINGRDVLNIHTAAFELVWSMIFDIIFPGEPFPFDIMETFDLYTKYFKTILVPTMFTPKFLHGTLAAGVNKEVQPHIERFKDMIKERPGHFGGADLHEKDCNYGGEYNDCHQYLAHGMMDFFALAGGAALPKLMRLVLFVLYEPDSRRTRYNGLFPTRKEARDFAKSQSKAYFLESARFFTMVNQFPYWEGPTGTKKKRVFLNIATASKDPNVYGRDAHLFRKRSHKLLADNNMAFADFIKDSTLFNGGNDHLCPAKDAAVMIGSIILEEIGIDDWEAGDDWNPVYVNAIPYVSYDANVVLKRVGSKSA